MTHELSRELDARIVDLCSEEARNLPAQHGHAIGTDSRLEDAKARRSRDWRPVPAQRDCGIDSLVPKLHTLGASEWLTVREGCGGDCDVRPARQRCIHERLARAR